MEDFQTDMAAELIVILWHNYREALLRVFDLNEFENLEVVVVDLTSQREGTNVNDVHVWVLD